jgi:flagellar hook-associated protein 2
MADFNLPGISSDIDVKGIIDKLVNVERKKLERFENAKDQLNKEKSVWTNLNNKVGGLQKASEALYGFRSPFEDKIALSEDEDSVSASAARVAQPSNLRIKVVQIAQNEVIVSDPVASKRVFESIPLKILIGDQEINIHFRGGKIENLADEINKEGGDLLQAKIAKDTPDTAVLILESRETGENKRITVTDGDTIEFFKKIGLVEEKPGLRVDTEMKPDRISLLEGSTDYRISDDVLTLEPENSVDFKLDQSVDATPSVILRVTLRALEIPKADEGIPTAWPELGGIGKVTVKDIDIEGERSISKIEEPVVKEEEPVVDNGVLAVGNEKGMIKRIEIEGLDDTFREYSFALSDLVPAHEKIDRIFFINKNTNRIVEYTNVVVEDTRVREGISPKHLIQEGRDAIVYIDGVKVKRDTNDIDDALKGVKLQVKKATPEEIYLTIDRDYEKITARIVDMIEKYNELLRYINEQTEVVPSSGLTEKSQGGVLTGDITVMGVKNKLQTIMMNPYPTDRGKELSLLAQIGISMGRSGSNWSDIKGGYLQVDEDRFVEAFEKYPEAIKQLFGADTDKDMIVDNGVSYVLNKTLKGYSDQRSGIITYRIKSTNAGIRETEKSIDDWKEHLEDYRKKLESDFTLMQRALQELEQNQKRLDNFSNQLKK